MTINHIAHGISTLIMLIECYWYWPFVLWLIDSEPVATNTLFAVKMSDNKKRIMKLRHSCVNVLRSSVVCRVYIRETLLWANTRCYHSAFSFGGVLFIGKNITMINRFCFWLLAFCSLRKPCPIQICSFYCLNRLRCKANICWKLF